MDTYYKISMLSDATEAQIAKLGIRAEMSIVVDASVLPRLSHLEIGTYGFDPALDKLAQFLNLDALIPEPLREHFHTDYISINPPEGFEITLDYLKRIADEFSLDLVARAEGMAPNMFLVIGRGTNLRRITLTEDNLPKIAANIVAEQAVPRPEANIAEWLVAIALIVEAGISAYRLYRDLQNEKDAAKRRDSEQQKHQEERRSHREYGGGGRSDSSGGPASDGLRDRIGRTA